MKLFRSSVLVSALVLGALSSVAAVQTPEEVDLSYKPKAGDEIIYAMKTNTSFDMGGQSAEIVISMRMKSKVKSVEDDKVTYVGTADQFKMTMNGQEMGDDNGGQMGSGQEATKVYLLSGDFVSASGGGQMGASAPRIEQMNTFYRPDGKKKVGDTWDHEIKANKERGIVEAKVRYTLVGSETLRDKKVWKISMLYAEMNADKPASLSGTIWIDAKNGEMEKWEADYTDVSFAEGMPPMNAKVVISRTN